MFAIWADTLVPYQAPVLALLRRYSRSGWRRFQNRAGTCSIYAVTCAMRSWYLRHPPR